MENDIQKYAFSYENSIFVTSWKFSVAFILDVRACYTGVVMEVNEVKGFSSVSSSA